MRFGLRELLEHLRLLHEELEDEEKMMAETKSEFEKNLAKMQLQAEAKKRRVRFLELQVRAIESRQSRQTRKKPE